MRKEDSFKHSDEDWENRRLCSDGNCIGIIGSDGHCKECGKKFLGDVSAADDFFTPTDVEDDIESADAPAPDMPNDRPNDTIDSPDWENRKLCSDGNCIGVIGPDGNCKVCGKPYENPKASS